jgi:hypothetical protein
VRWRYIRERDNRLVEGTRWETLDAWKAVEEVANVTLTCAVDVLGVPKKRRAHDLTEWIRNWKMHESSFRKRTLIALKTDNKGQAGGCKTAAITKGKEIAGLRHKV